MARKSIQEIHVLTHNLEHAGAEVHFWWIPGHVNIVGNECANALAKEAAMEDISPSPWYSISRVRKWVSDKMQEEEWLLWETGNNNTLHCVSPVFVAANLLQYVGLNW